MSGKSPARTNPAGLGCPMDLTILKRYIDQYLKSVADKKDAAGQRSDGAVCGMAKVLELI
jgi:hypothetical protein